jgi:hypothetical protein
MAYTTFSQTKNDQLLEPMFLASRLTWPATISKNMTSLKS